MEAAALSAKQVKHTLRQQASAKKRPAKNVLCSPFHVTWPPISQDEAAQIRDEIARFFNQHPTERPRATGASRRQRAENRMRKLEALPEETKWLRKRLVHGINCVRKGLVREQIGLVLVDASVPLMFTSALLHLVAVKRCPAGALSGLSNFLKPLVKFPRRISAVGFLAPDPNTDVVAGYATLVARVTELLPPVEVEWVREADQTADLVRQMSLDTDDAEEAEEDDESNSSTVDVTQFYVYKTDRPSRTRHGRKRKLSVETRMEDMDSEFISLGSEDMDETDERKRKTMRRETDSAKESDDVESADAETVKTEKRRGTKKFISGRVIRVQGNPNKKRKKKKNKPRSKNL